MVIVGEIIFFYIKIQVVIFVVMLLLIINKKGYPIGYIPPMETEETYYKRINLLNKINESNNYKYVVGPLQEVAEYIENYTKIIIKQR